MQGEENNNNVQNDVENEMFSNLLDPNSPILQPVQEKITEQLTKRNEELLLNVKDEEDQIKKLNTEREAIGVELYAVQQQLAKQQETLERCHDNFNAIQHIREDAEYKRSQYQEAAKQRKAHLESQRKKFYEYQIELDRISAKLKRIAKYHDQIVSDIAVKRRQTYKTEEEMEKIEKTKKEQDILIDRMNEQIKDLQNQISIYETQIKEQRSEKEMAKELLTEATAEMEAIRFEKKGLIQQWKSSHVGMQRRDQALQETENGLRLQKEQIKELHNEIEGYKTTINTEKDKNAKLTSVFIKHENEKEYMDKKLQTIEEELSERENQYQQFKNTLEQTEEQSRKEEQISKVTLAEMISLEQKIAKTSNSIRELENGLLQLFSEQTTFKKDYQSSLLAIQKKKDLLRDKELVSAQLENELSRIRVDELQTSDHNKALTNIVQELENDLAQKDMLIEKYEVEIRRKHDEIERKQSYLDKLNRQYEKLVANQQQENFGPLEATIHNITKAIANTNRTNEQLKKDWTRCQSELVELVNQSEQLSEQLSHIQSKQVVLTQKRSRLENNTMAENHDYISLENEMNQMHHELVKLNEMISKNSKLQQILANTNYDKENEILSRLRQREAESIHLEKSIQNLRQEKRELLDQLIDVERQIMYWEKKIELQKEIQDTLDPEVGQEEIIRMKKEIHIMEQRLIELRRLCKTKTLEMVKAVEKKAIIMIKGKSQDSIHKRKSNGANSSANTKATIHREEIQLNQEVEKRKKELAKLNQQIKKYQQEAEDAALQIQTIELKELTQEKAGMAMLRDQIETMNVEKVRIGVEKERIKDMVRRYQLILKGSQFKFETRVEEQEAKRNELEQQRRKIIEIVHALQTEYASSSGTDTAKEQFDVILSILNNTSLL